MKNGYIDLKAPHGSFYKDSYYIVGAPFIGILLDIGKFVIRVRLQNACATARGKNICKWKYGCSL